MRVVSLLPSATETVAALGCEGALVGISHECDYPPSVRVLPRVSSPRIDPSRSGAVIDQDIRGLIADGLSIYEVDADVLTQLRPDLVITQDHCEVCAVPLDTVEQALYSITGRDIDVCTLHPDSLESVISDFERIAEALGCPDAGKELVRGFQRQLEDLRQTTESLDPPTVVLVEWLQPPMIAGGWMPALAACAGTQPLFVRDADRFATVTWDDIASADPDWLLILACGFDVQRTLSELGDADLANNVGAVPAVKAGRWAILDGNAFFNRPSPRLADSAALLAATVHPELGEGLKRFAGSYAKPGWPLT